MIDKKHNKLLKTISFILLVVFLFLFVYASFFAHPIADDFSYLVSSSKENLIDYLYNQYFIWSGGRYSSNILWFFNPYKFGLVFYQLSSVSIIISIILGYFLILKSLLENVSNNFLFGISLLLTCLVLYNLPNLAEGIYWYTGAIAYTFSTSLALAYFAIIILYFKNKYFLNKILHLIFILVLSVIIIGFNEVLSLFVLTIICVANIINRPPHKKLLFIILLITLACFMTILLSPGSANRAALFENNRNFTYSFIMAMLQTIRFLAKFISIPVILLSFVYIKFHNSVYGNNLFLKHFLDINKWISLFMIFFIIFIAAFLPYYATGILGQHRTINLAYVLFLPLWFINLSVWINYYKIQPIKINPILKVPFSIIFFLSLFFTSNGYDIINDILDKKLNQFDNQMNQRYELIEKHKKNNSLELQFQPIKNPPKTLFVLDIQKDSTDWINEGYRLYFNTKKHIKLKSPTGE